MQADAEVAFLQADNDARIRRALVHRARPHRGPYHSGAQVFFYRKKAAVSRHDVENCWCGPAVVICQDGEGVWLDHMGTLIKSSPDLLRFATREELLACQLVSAQLALRSRDLGKQGSEKSFVDLTKDIPEPVELPPQASGMEENRLEPPEGAAPPRPPTAPGPPTPVTQMPNRVPVSTEAAETEVEAPVLQAVEPGVDDVETELPRFPELEDTERTEQEPQSIRLPSKEVNFGPTEVRYIPNRHEQASSSNRAREEQPELVPQMSQKQPPVQPEKLRPTSRASGEKRPFPEPPSSPRTVKAKSSVPFGPPISRIPLDVGAPAVGTEVGEPTLQPPEPQVAAPGNHGELGTSGKTNEAHQASGLVKPRESYHVDVCAWQYFLSEELPRSNRRAKLLYEAYHGESLLAKGKRSKEVSYKSLPPELRSQYDEAMAKEWQGWLDLKAVRVIPPREAREIPKKWHLRTRYVLTDKNSPLRTPSQDLPVLPKARLIVWGHMDPELPWIRTDAPTISELGTHVVYQAAASWGTPLVHGDIKQAFLSGILTKRRTFLVPPVQGLPGVEPGSLLEPLNAIYGYADAPRCWWLKLAKTAEKAGWVQTKLEKALFYFYDRSGKLQGLGGPHVDDWVCTGRGVEYERALSKLRNAFSWGAWDIDSFSHCGRQVSRDKDGSVRVEQLKYIENIKPIAPSSRLTKVPLTDSEMGAARSAFGNLGWAAKQTQPQVSFDVSKLLGELTKKERPILGKINKELSRLQGAPATLKFPAALDLEHASVVAFSDASWANAEASGSQGGLIHGLVSPDAEKGKEVPISILSWSSFRIKRIRRSTLSAEGQAACLAVEHGDYLKVLLEEAFDSRFHLVNYQAKLQRRGGILVIDVKSLWDFLSKDTGRLPVDKRLGIVLRLLQSYIAQSKCGVRWVSGPQQLADPLTKEGCDASYLRWVMSHGIYRLMKDEDLDSNVAADLKQVQDRLVEQHLSSGLTKEQVRSRRKGAKHRARVENLRNRMVRDEKDRETKPSFFSITLDFAVFSALQTLYSNMI